MEDYVNVSRDIIPEREVVVKSEIKLDLPFMILDLVHKFHIIRKLRHALNLIPLMTSSSGTKNKSQIFFSSIHTSNNIQESLLALSCSDTVGGHTDIESFVSTSGIADNQ